MTDPLHKATVANGGGRSWYAADAISWRSTLLKETEEADWFSVQKGISFVQDNANKTDIDRR